MDITNIKHKVRDILDDMGLNFRFQSSENDCRFVGFTGYEGIDRPFFTQIDYSEESGEGSVVFLYRKCELNLENLLLINKVIQKIQGCKVFIDDDGVLFTVCEFAVLDEEEDMEYYVKQAFNVIGICLDDENFIELIKNAKDDAEDDVLSKN